MVTSVSCSMSPQARGSAGGRRRHDAASQEDHDKPYVCDSEYLSCCVSQSSYAALAALGCPRLFCFQLCVATFPPVATAVAGLWAPWTVWQGTPPSRAALQDARSPFWLSAYVLPRSLSLSRFILHILLQFRITNKGVTRNSPTKVTGFCHSPFLSL